MMIRLQLSNPEAESRFWRRDDDDRAEHRPEPVPRPPSTLMTIDEQRDRQPEHALDRHEADLLGIELPTARR